MAGLELIAERLGMPSALLFASGPAGRLRALAGVGMVSDGASLRSLAETLEPSLTVLDPPGGSFAAGIRLGSDEGALLVLSADAPSPGADWEVRFASAAQLALSLVRADAHGSERLPLLHEVAVHPGGFDERLTHALQRATEILGLNAAAFARTSGDQWLPQSVFDPLGRLFPTRPVSLGDTFCAFTSRSDGPVAVENASLSTLGVSAPAAYIGAPVYVGGRCVGTLCIVGVVARDQPFTAEDRTLVEALASWIGVALSGRSDARRRTARKANLAAFFDGSPLGMGLVQIVDGELSFLAVNAAAAEALGSSPDAVTGRSATDLGLNSSLIRKWIAACEEAVATRSSSRVEVEVGTTTGLRRLVTTIASMPGAGDPRFTFVVEDTTGQSYSRRAAPPPTDLADQAPAATFSLDLEGVVTGAHGRLAHRAGLTGLLGRSLLPVLEDVPNGTVALEAAASGLDASWTMEAGGEPIVVHVGPQHDLEGTVVGVVGTAVPALEGDGRAAARSAFLRHLNLELRSPLTAILGYAELLDAQAPAAELAEVRDVIVRSGERLLSALDDLLDLTVLDDDDLTSRPAPVDVSALVSSIVEAHRTAADARRIVLEVASDLPPGPILLDASLFERAARHLVGSAVASTKSDHVQVHLSSAEPDAFEFTVAGVPPGAGPMGIGPDLLHRISGALGGTASRLSGERPGWVLRLPRTSVPMVDLEAAGRDGAQGEAPAMAAVQVPQ